MNLLMIKLGRTVKLVWTIVPYVELTKRVYVIKGEFQKNRREDLK